MKTGRSVDANPRCLAVGRDTLLPVECVYVLETVAEQQLFVDAPRRAAFNPCGCHLRLAGRCVTELLFWEQGANRASLSRAGGGNCRPGPGDLRMLVREASTACEYRGPTPA